MRANESGSARKYRLPRALAWVLRIRTKLIVLHTAFSLTLALVLIATLQPEVNDILRRAQAEECAFALELYHADAQGGQAITDEEVLILARGSASELALERALASRARETPGIPLSTLNEAGAVMAVLFDEQQGEYFSVTLGSSATQGAVRRLYVVLVVALLVVYALIAVAMEALVLPRQVYRPISRLLRADEAVQLGNREAELIPDDEIPNDELGGIMRSRNRSIVKLREQEKALADALDQVEVIACELKKKNHLLETARRNLADQDRLVSLGMLSAGIAHELNTPLAVLKGTTERFAENPGGAVEPDKLALMIRVIRRLERLGDSLLDFARARSPRYASAALSPLADEAWTLISLDRDAGSIVFRNDIPPDLNIEMDADRMTQVFVNIIRNAVDAIQGAGEITVSAEYITRDGGQWALIRTTDDGPGISPTLFPKLFEPFATSRLDANGTGLGLAVAEGIIKEHNGVITAQNNEGRGATFEIVIPVAPICDDEPRPDESLFDQTTEAAL